MTLTIHAPEYPVLTENPEPRPVAKRRFSKVDGLMLALSVAALTLPVALRLQAEAQAAAPRIAMAADISPVRPIDIALGFSEPRAASGFVDAAARPAPPAAPAVQRPAPETPDVAAPDAAPVEQVKPEIAAAPTPPAEQAEPEIEAPVDVAEDQEPVIPPKPDALGAVAELALSQRLDFSIDTPTSDEPPVTVAEAAPEPDAEPAAEPAQEPVEEEIAEGTGPAPAASPIPFSRPAILAIRDDAPETVETVTLDSYPAPEQPELSTAPVTTIAEETLALNSPIDSGPLSLDPTSLPSNVKALTPASLTVAAASLANINKAPAAGEKTPEIALVIAAAGLNVSTTRYAIEALPAGVTLAFAPIKEEATALAADAKRDGHTVLVEIPLEPVNRRRDPGPLTLRVSDTPEANMERLDRALARIPNADGASTYLGARFNADVRGTSMLVDALRQRNLFLFENEPTALSLFQQAANRSDLSFAQGTIKIDRDRNSAAIAASLDRLEREARRTGRAVGVGTTLRGTITAVATWAKEAEKRGVRLVPIVAATR